MKGKLVSLVSCLLCLTVSNVIAASFSGKPTPDKIIRMLKAGNKRFIAGKSEHPNTNAQRIYQAGTENQGNHAYVTIIACSDSRVPVERIFDAGIMDDFVIRVAGNICDIDEVGSIEYGLAHVKTPVLVVLGHTQCGAVTAVTHAIQKTGHPLEENITELLDEIEPAVQRAIKKYPHLHGDEIIPNAIEENVWQGIRDLFVISSVARELVNSGKVKVVGAIYDVGSGNIRWLPESNVNLILAEVEFSVGKSKVFLNANDEKEVLFGTIPLNQETEAEFPTLAKITSSQAVTVALSTVDGQVLKTELENENGFLVYGIEIVTQEKSIMEIKVDAGSGRILATNQDTNEENEDSDGKHEDHNFEN